MSAAIINVTLHYSPVVLPTSLPPDILVSTGSMMTNDGIWLVLIMILDAQPREQSNAELKSKPSHSLVLVFKPGYNLFDPLKTQTKELFFVIFYS